MGRNNQKDINSVEEYDYLMFQRIQVLLKDEELYLTPRLSRKRILTLTNIPKNKFASLFVKFTGVSFIHYVNHLRLEHAAKMLLEHPEYTIETIAIDSGIPKTQTFYRLFFKEYGVTPSVYREQQKALLNDK